MLHGEQPPLQSKAWAFFDRLLQAKVATAGHVRQMLRVCKDEEEQKALFSRVQEQSLQASSISVQAQSCPHVNICKS